LGVKPKTRSGWQGGVALGKKTRVQNVRKKRIHRHRNGGGVGVQKKRLEVMSRVKKG